jgi:hypothetical protein
LHLHLQRPRKTKAQTWGTHSTSTYHKAHTQHMAGLAGQTSCTPVDFTARGAHCSCFSPSTGVFNNTWHCSLTAGFWE